MFKTLHSFSRFIPWGLCIFFTILMALQIQGGHDTLGTYLWFGFFTFLSVVGLQDATQKNHAILRNYPVSGHLRFLFETFRPELRQYLIESDNEKLPFSRNQRALVYQRAL